jgi:hypothetical protein
MINSIISTPFLVSDFKILYHKKMSIVQKKFYFVKLVF